MTEMTAVRRARSALDKATRKEEERADELRALVADAFPDDEEPQPTGGSPRGWKKQAASDSGYSGQGMTHIKAQVRTARREAGEPVRRASRVDAMAGLAEARRQMDRASQARERAREAYNRAIAAAMPPRPEKGSRASGEEVEILRQMRELTGYDTSFLRRIQDQAERRASAE